MKDNFDVQDPVFNPQHSKTKPRGKRPGLSPVAGYHLVSRAVFEKPTWCTCQWILPRAPTLTSAIHLAGILRVLLWSWNSLVFVYRKDSLRAKKWLSAWLRIKSGFLNLPFFPSLLNESKWFSREIKTQWKLKGFLKMKDHILYKKGI
jgi:hypothetical protein